jgi:hypothetical protein
MPTRRVSPGRLSTDTVWRAIAVARQGPLSQFAVAGSVHGIRSSRMLRLTNETTVAGTGLPPHPVHQTRAPGGRLHSRSLPTVASREGAGMLSDAERRRLGEIERPGGAEAMMTTRSANCRSTVDAPSAFPSQATTPTGPGRSDALPRVVAALQRDAVALTWDLTVYQLHEAFSRCMAAPSTDILDAGASQELARTRSEITAVVQVRPTRRSLQCSQARPRRSRAAGTARSPWPARTRRFLHGRRVG